MKVNLHAIPNIVVMLQKIDSEVIEVSTVTDNDIMEATTIYFYVLKSK